MPLPIIDAVIEAIVGAQRRAFAQFIRFAAVGAFNTALDFAVYLWLTRTSPFWAAHIVGAATISFMFGVTSSFILNNFWTFGHDAGGWHRRAPRFLLVAAGGLLWNDLILHALTTVGLHDILAKLAATALVLAWNFTLQKRWTFRA